MASLSGARLQLLPRLQFQDRYKVHGVYQRFVLASLSVAKSPFIGRGSELTDSFLQLFVELKFDDLTRRVGVETSTQRIKDAVQTDFGTHVLTVPSVDSEAGRGIYVPGLRFNTLAAA